MGVTVLGVLECSHSYYVRFHDTVILRCHRWYIINGVGYSTSVPDQRTVLLQGILMLWMTQFYTLRSHLDQVFCIPVTAIDNLSSYFLHNCLSEFCYNSQVKSRK